VAAVNSIAVSFDKAVADFERSLQSELWVDNITTSAIASTEAAANPDPVEVWSSRCTSTAAEINQSLAELGIVSEQHVLCLAQFQQQLGDHRAHLADVGRKLLDEQVLDSDVDSCAPVLAPAPAVAVVPGSMPTPPSSPGWRQSRTACVASRSCSPIERRCAQWQVLQQTPAQLLPPQVQSQPQLRPPHGVGGLVCVASGEGAPGSVATASPVLSRSASPATPNVIRQRRIQWASPATHGAELAGATGAWPVPSAAPSAATTPASMLLVHRTLPPLLPAAATLPLQTIAQAFPAV